jgi:hypothetical protein
MKKALVLVSMAVVVAVLVAGLSGAFSPSTPTVYASKLAGISGSGITGISVQNLDASQPATIVADFYRQNGGPAIPITKNNVAAGTAVVIYLPTETALQNGAYAAIISADRQIAAIARTDWNSSGGSAIYSNVQPSTKVSVPLAVKQYYGSTSLVSIQNTDTSNQATVTVKLYKTGETAPTVTHDYTIGIGTSITIDLTKDPAFLTVPASFLGSMTVESQTEIGVQSFVDLENSQKAVYAFEGVPSEAASSKLFAPLFRRQYYGTTGMSVVNPGTSPVQAKVTYYGSLGSCAGATVEHGPVSIAAGSSVVFYQDGATPGVPAPNLPTNCAGSAVIEATGGDILAIVNDANGTTTSAAFNAVSSEGGARKVALPLYRNGHLGSLLTTGIQAMNVGTAPANVRLTVSDSNSAQIACGPACSTTIQPNASYTWYPPNVAGLKDRRNVYGSAVLESDQPLAVIVNDFSENGQFDSSIYNGIKADTQ